MFTRNYWKYIAAAEVNQTGSLYSSTQKPKFITVSGAEPDKNVYPSSSSYTTKVPTDYVTTLSRIGTTDVSANVSNSESGCMLGTSGTHVIFGSGNAPATVDDYKLSGDVIQNITYSSISEHSFAEDGSSSIASRTYTITNNNDTDITIGEVGIFGESYYPTSSTKYSHYFIMFERTALDNPITIPANGGVGQVTYTIQQNYPV